VNGVDIRSESSDGVIAIAQSFHRPLYRTTGFEPSSRTYNAQTSSCH
jgi:hypothetical protein